jgi:hypothetical protein
VLVSHLINFSYSFHKEEKKEKEKEMTINVELEVMKPHVLARDRGVDEKISSPPRVLIEKYRIPTRLLLFFLLKYLFFFIKRPNFSFAKSIITKKTK